MFYNPIVMIEFRKLAQEEEKVCDDIAVAMTGNAKALAEAIDMLRPAAESTNIKGVEAIAAGIERYSHEVLLKNRVLRLGDNRGDNSSWGVPYFITMAFIIGINYFIV